MFRHVTATSVTILGFLTMNVTQAEGQRPPSQTQERDLQPSNAFRECEDCPEMIVVPPGRFLMGARKGEETFADTPQHPVRISAAFAVAKLEVTVEQYAAFVRDTGHEMAASCRSTVDILNGFADRDRKLSWRDPGFPQHRSSPVTCVSWNDAKAYVSWLAKRTGKPYRLLSEAEWEFAAHLEIVLWAFASMRTAATRILNAPPRSNPTSPATMAMPIRHPAGPSPQTVSAFTTCREMCRNGWRTARSCRRPAGGMAAHRPTVRRG
jgi:Sulfatase-modifying factor enzyme 1